MRLARIGHYTPFLLCALLVFAVSLAVHAQETPARIHITWVDTSQLPQIEVYVSAVSANGGRYPGLFADMLQLFEDGAERSPSTYDAPRGTYLVFLIDADLAAQAYWSDIREAIESYASPSWMDEDVDYAAVIVGTGQQVETLVETSYHVGVSNAFIQESGAYYEPSFQPATPLNDLIADTLAGLQDQTPTPGMYRALMVFSAGDAASSARSAESVATLASEQNIPLFTVMLGENPMGEQTMQQLAQLSNGQFYTLDSPASLAPLWEILSSHRLQYAVTYRSRIVASGSHSVRVQTQAGVGDSYGFDITVLDPQVEITLPQPSDVILRSAPKLNASLAEHEPRTQPIKYHWEWPDGHERQITTVQLRVNGIVQQQLDLTTSDDRSLVWDISNLEAGPYSLRVEVVDELGLTGQSLEIPVAIQIGDAESAPVASETPSPGIVKSALGLAKEHLGCLTLSGLSLGALVIAFFAYRRRLSALGRSPIAFLRRQTFFRPFDKVLISIQRLTGPLRIKKPKIGQATGKDKGTAWLDVVQGQTSTRTPIEIKAELTFGRSGEKAQVVFADRSVSRLHMSLIPEHGGKYRVFNHSGQNTWVSEQRVPDHGLLLKDGDEIRIGQVRLRFRRKKH